MAQPGVNNWSEFAELREFVKNERNHTINKLKFILDGINEEVKPARPLSKYGRKQELIERILAEIDDYHAQNNTISWARARLVLIEVRETEKYTPKRGPHGPISSMSQSIAPGHQNQNYAAKPYPYVPANPTPINYNAYQNPSRTIQNSAASLVPPKPTGIRFASSPFLRVDQAVSPVVECLESISAIDRRAQTVSFTLNADQVQKLLSPGPKYQLRLYCTSSAYYSTHRPNNGTCQMEFPPTCEVRVNGALLNANLKGLKKKPGTAPPADLGVSIRSSVGAQNRVEMVYVNSQQPVHKKYYLIVQLVEVTPVENVVERIRNGKFKSKVEILATMSKSTQLDDDIEAGPQKMSLKCPLSYVRITTPARSIKCVHPQCFEANSWFGMMEQTTTWLCPVCEKQLNVEEIIVDGYFDDILKSTDEDTDDVMVEADGEWHTTDNKYASEGWRRRQPVGNGKAPLTLKTAVPQPSRLSTPPKARAQHSDIEVIELLDSDDDEVDASTPSISVRQSSVRPTLPSIQRSDSARASSSRRAVPVVIDLTLSSDEEDERPPPPAPITPRRPEKRKDRETPPSLGDALTKRQRTDSFPPPPPPAAPQSNNTSPSLPSLAASIGANATGSAIRPPPQAYQYGIPAGYRHDYNGLPMSAPPAAAPLPPFQRRASNNPSQNGRLY
ncbi:PINIT domain-containing protein [Auriculariales sp. MPI-PUGE-AT-0066]|nr:PINIT domain-containing protein [Auriculariales sp. MPI-PUGE-AT-0066]